METGTTTITIGSLIIIVSGLIGYVTYLRNIKKDVKEDTKEDISKKTELDVKLGLVLQTNAEIKSDVKTLDSKLDNFKDRLTRCEESTKQAHKRIDEMKGSN